MKLRLQVSADRARTAAARLTARGEMVAVGQAVASACATFAAQQGNPDCDPLRACGHAPLGAYRLVHCEPVEPGFTREYGSHLLLFEPTAGAALEAESFGRLALLVYGGARGRDGRMRPTQGGVRLEQGMLDQLVATTLARGTEVVLELVPIERRAWWAFWRRPVRTQPLSTEPPARIDPPWDEPSLIRRLLQSAPRRPRVVDEPDTARDHRGGRDDRSPDSDAFRGGGGQFGGAGASGRWDAAAPRSEVDRAAHITGVAAGAAVAAVALAAHAESRAASETDGATSGASASTTSDFAADASDGAAADTGASADGASGSSDGAASTSY